MPNWVKNRVFFKGDDDKIINLLNTIRGDSKKDEESVIDFNKIIPMPEGLIDTVSPPRSKEEAKENIKKYGEEDWYEWAIKYWGTKWNACNQSLLNNKPFNSGFNIEFDTAWSCPKPIFDKLAEMFPDIEIEVEYADEDLGYNCGTISYKCGKESKQWTPSENDDALGTAIKIWGLQDAYEKVNGEWIFI